MRVFFFGLGYCARRLIQREPWIEASGTARTRGDRRRAASRGRSRPIGSTAPRRSRGWSRRLERPRRSSSPSRRATGQARRSIASGPRSPPRRRCGASSIIRPSGFMATTAALGSTRQARRGRARRADWARLEDEARWTAAARERGAEADILRLAGIYGPGRNALVNLRRGEARRIVKPGQVFNRAHVDDIAEISTPCPHAWP